MGDRGGEWTEVTDDNGHVVDSFWWKRCEKPGCGNFICARLSPIFCWPHSGSGPTMEELIERVNDQEVVNG